MIWSLALAAVGVLGIYLSGKKNYWGWGIGLGAQVLWIVYAVVTQQWGFIISALAYGWVYGKNFLSWRKDATATAPERSFLPGDIVRIELAENDCFNEEFSGRQAVVTHGPDRSNGWLVSSAPGSLRCVAKELTMITPREDRDS
jgi:hypothetical protein